MFLKTAFRQFAKKSKLNKEPDFISYTPQQALRLVRAYALANFDENVDIAMQLGINIKRGDQVVRGTVALPYSLGNSSKIICFTSESSYSLAQEADLVGSDELIEKISSGQQPLDFDKAIATPEMQVPLKRIGKILGPKGLMPSTKLQTIVDREKLQIAIRNMKKGSITFRNDDNGGLHAPLGKVSFSDQTILGNLAVFVDKVLKSKPKSVKGSLIVKAHLTSTMGPGWRLDLKNIDPNNKASELFKFQQDALKL